MIDKVIGAGEIPDSGFQILDKARSAGKPPREVTVGVYIQRALWEVTLFVVVSSENHSVASNIS